ncbi:MaoC family dehydratase N-terminal domain-containing protein [Elioraea sp.]|uniref:FAS1-like dehydratase domain-containing protein n=1 Tax=Elioraea sp. TaxID=2185103 RepID=UPI0025C047EB|nr:MaoC family dehydratase N-terminal domain-containing protein [Elioraea sp.]
MSEWDAWVGRSETAEDTVDHGRMAALAATLDRSLADCAPDGALPPLWHWTQFQAWVPASAIGPDGHPKRGGFLPPVHDLPRRMFAGGRLGFPGQLFPGERIVRTSTITKVSEKTGSTGQLVFVTVRHVIEGPRGVAITEEHDIVYRGLEGAAVKTAPPPPPLQAAATRRDVVPDPVLLFRYSALTANGHRIHYDRSYVTEVEGYPGLIVHGPLQATLMAGLAQQVAPGRRIASFSFRGLRPLFDLAPFAVLAVAGEGAVTLETRDAAGYPCMQAEAVMA